MVALGEEVTIVCRSQDDFRGTFYLTRFESLSDDSETVRTKEAAFSQAEFFVQLLSKSQGGIYSCRSCLDEWECSSYSDKIYLNLTDPSLTKPFIQILNADHPYFPIQCEGTKPHLTFALMNSRQLIGYMAAEPGEKRVVFHLSSLRLKEAECYTCRYHEESSPFVWSVPSDPLELPLRDPEMMNPTMKTIHGGPNASEHPDEVSYAILNYQPQKTQQATNPRQTSEPCLYASVVKNTVSAIY
ncbi:hypothetical protein E2320_003136, partial [Naja naja]